MNKWSDAGAQKIKNIKISVLKKKIMMSFLIDNYSFQDKVFRWTHTFLAVTTPILTTIQTLIYDRDRETSNTPGVAAVVLGFVAAGMLKLKEYVKYDKIRDSAKEQTVKYQQLYERIENEALKSDDKRQIESDFMYWLGREFQHIEVNDPELSASEKKKFIQLCRERNIPYDEDLELLNTLSHEKSSTTAPLNTIVLETPKLPDKPTVNKILDRHVNNVPHDTSQQQSQQENKIQSTNDSDHDEVDTLPPTMHKVLSLKTDYSSLSRMRSPSEEEERKKYKDSLKNMNTKADMQWAMDRLSNLE
jgi:hypothetical protein